MKPITKRGVHARLLLRPLRIEDLPAIVALHGKVFPGIPPWSEANLRDHLSRFPEGQIGVDLDGELVATSSSLIVKESDLDPEHVYADVCPSGFLREHNDQGDMLYGLDIAVDPSARGLRLARRIYDARKQLVARRNLRGIIFGGRMPGYHKHQKSLSASEYVTKVLRKELRDPVVTAQRANGFVVQGVVPNYLPSDAESCGYAVMMEWSNPSWEPHDPRVSRPRRIRVAAVQYQMRSVSSFDDFAEQCEFFIDTASEYRSDFVLFPELITNQLLSLVPSERPGEAARRLDEFTTRYVELFGGLAMRYNINVVAGTHLSLEQGTLYNIAYLFHRDGRIDKQYKVHVTPSESRWWGVSAGDRIQTFDTDSGRVAIAICYDVEFPELARLIKAEGAEVLFVPYNTDLRSGHLRVRVCSAARAIENHLYVVTAGAVGNLPQVPGADIHYAQSAILTPSDIAFARDGVAAEATPNVETMLVHDLDLAMLRRTEASGTVRPWPDRRTDLYRIHYSNGEPNPKREV